MKINTQQTTALNTFDFISELEIEGVTAGYFPEFQNVGIEYEVIQHKTIGTGGVEIVQKIPGRRKIKAVILKRKISANLDLWEWRRMVEEGNVTAARKDCSIAVYDSGLSQIARWNLSNAWPIGLISERDVNGVNYEVLTLGCEELQRVS